MIDWNVIRSTCRIRMLNIKQECEMGWSSHNFSLVAIIQVSSHTIGDNSCLISSWITAIYILSFEEEMCNSPIMFSKYDKPNSCYFKNQSDVNRCKTHYT